MELSVDPALVTGFVLGLVRASAWVFVAPPFSTRAIPIRVKVGLAAALALAAAPRVGEEPLPLDTASFVGALVLQVAVGLALGFLTLMLVSAVQAAGSLVDLFGGYSIATVYDPLADASAAVFGRFYQLLAVTLLFALDAHLLLVRGFLASFEAVPTSGLDLGDLNRVLTRDLGVFFAAAIEVAAPVLAVLFVAEIAMGLLARAAPQMNVFALGFSVRVVVALLLVGVSIPLLVPALENLVGRAVSGVG
ncbi:MAG: flagellar biosynthetic protein FliR [Acidimicrobiia bacterium]|nr:flagellar biosynthetic protein FliR [Acidimicrobiia bacterium]